jgi:hypothetical protein
MKYFEAIARIFSMAQSRCGVDIEHGEWNRGTVRMARGASDSKEA